MQISQVLFSQGFGTRRECESLVAAGFVSMQGVVCEDPWQQFDTDGLVFGVQGVSWPYRERALVVLNKPAGYECSQKPKHHASVVSLLPAPLRRRGLQPVGRLDEDTTGLLLLTDDGSLIHRLTSPRHHVPKIYEVVCKHEVDSKQVAALLAGVVLDDDPKPVKAAACEAAGTHGIRLTLTEGKYHQVKRMVAAVGNRVEGLHRSSFGALVLPTDLAPGQWRWLDGPQALTSAPMPTQSSR